MKRLVLNILISLLVIINIPALKSTAVENSGLEIGSSTVSAQNGDTVDVPVEIVSNPGIIALSLDVQYDSDLIQLTEVEDCEIFGDASFTPSGDYSLVPFRIMWEDALTPQNHTETGRIAVLHFKVLDNPFSETEIEIIPQNENIFDFNLDDVSCNTAKSTIKIGSGSPEQTENPTESASESTTAEKTEKTTKKVSESDVKPDATSETVSEENSATENNTKNDVISDDENSVTSDADSESQTNADYEEVEENKNTDNSNTGIIIVVSVCAIAVIAVALTMILKKKNKK